MEQHFLYDKIVFMTFERKHVWYIRLHHVYRRFNLYSLYTCGTSVPIYACRWNSIFYVLKLCWLWFCVNFLCFKLHLCYDKIMFFCSVGILFVGSSFLHWLYELNEWQLEKYAPAWYFDSVGLYPNLNWTKLCLKFWSRLHFCMFLLETVSACMLFSWLSWMYHILKQWEVIDQLRYHCVGSFWIVLKTNAISRWCSVHMRWWLFIHKIGLVDLCQSRFTPGLLAWEGPMSSMHFSDQKL